ncbi:MAG: putative colanic acid biosynthesis UDP-glucose lipid carrier transferase [Candidatus Endobugula sp.]|jgi:putative colanic acid biosynthesis UDP-glucose lipid carrier transferase
MPISQGYDQLGRRRQLLKKRESLVYSIQIIVDLLLTAGLLFILINSKVGNVVGSIPDNYRILLVTAVLLQFTIYSVYGVYRRSGSLSQGCYRLSIAWFIFLLLLISIGFVTKVSETFSREVFLLWAVIGYFLQMIAYAFMYRAIGVYRDHFSERAECLVVGRGRLAEHLFNSINANKWLPDRIVGLVSYDDQYTGGDDRREKTTIKLLGDIKDIKHIIYEYNIKRVYIAVPLNQSGSVEGLHIELLDANVDLIWVPDIYAMKLLNHSIREVAGLPLIFLNESPITSTRTGIFFKALMDRSVSILALLLFTPLLLFVVLAIKLTSKGPVFFKQERHGWDGAVFKIWKFRTMYLHDEAGKVTQASKGDQRVTPIGGFLRRTSIDELPQLINVLRGEMSLVGPRPHAVAHNNYYDDHIEAYLLRHRIKPGITGLAQIHGCRGETQVIDKMRERVEYDLSYINNWSLWLDIKILIKTPFALLSNDVY